MHQDRQGNLLSGANPAAVEYFDNAVRAFNIYRGDPIADLDRAIEAAPEFVMAHLLKAHLYGLATEPEAAAEAIALVDRARNLRSDDRERSHIAVLDRLLTGDWNAAANTMDLHNMCYPRDLVGLQVGHLMDFYRGNARNLRDRIARVLPHWSESVPGHHTVLGMQAFGLEETGDYARAEDAGRHAIDLEPLDCWAHHAVAHVMEMQGRAQDGIGWMIAREPHWSGDDNFFKVHNWWHRALYHLDLGQIDEVFQLYDGPIRQDRSLVALDLVDASALLWRLELAGHDVGERWSELARCWDRHANGRLYPFNDWHAAMAYLGVGDDSAMQRLDAALEASGAGTSDTAEWARDIARPLLDGFAAFRNGDYRRCVERLHPVRAIAHRFGGSHAQRDIIDWTLTEAAVRAGWNEISAALATERLALKPYSPMNQGFLRRSSTGRAPTSR